MNLKKVSALTADKIMKKAFTLIEVMVVVAILMILAALIIPAINHTSKRRTSGQTQGSSYSRFNVGDRVTIKSIDIDGTIQAVVPSNNGVNYIVTYKLPNGELKNIEVSELQIVPR